MVNVEVIARFAHEINRAYCLSLGDTSQLPWSDAPEWQKESAVNGVMKHLERPLTPPESHASWLEQKTNEGWVWGPEKKPELKQHPCMLPYDALPQDQRAKDYLFGTVVQVMKYLSPIDFNPEEVNPWLAALPILTWVASGGTGRVEIPRATLDELVKVYGDRDLMVSMHQSKEAIQLEIQTR